MEPEEGEETPVTEPPHAGVLSRDQRLQLRLAAALRRSRPRRLHRRSPFWDWGLGLGSGTGADLGLGVIGWGLGGGGGGGTNALKERKS